MKTQEFEFEPQQQPNDEGSWGSNLLQGQGLLLLFAAVLLICNLGLGQLPFADTIAISFALSIGAAVAMFVKEHSSPGPNFPFSKDADLPIWLLVPGIMMAETVITIALYLFRAQIGTAFMPILLAAGIVAVERFEGVTYWRLYLLASYTGFLLAAVNSVAAPAICWSLIVTAMLEIGVALFGYYYQLFNRRGEILSVVCTAVTVIMGLAGLVVLLH